jgi:hypothetical protein
LGQRLKLRSYNGPSPLGKVIARQLRAGLRRANVDSRRITAIELIPRTPVGRFWLLDISAWHGNLTSSDHIHLPKVSVSNVVIPEGDSGEITLNVPVTIDGVVSSRANLWVQLTDYADFEQPTRGFPLVLDPGTTSASFPFSYPADEVYNPYPQLIQVVLLAKRNAVTTDFDGSILIEEDEAAPQLAVATRDVVAAEGASLTWNFQLSRPMVNGGFWSIQLLPPEGRFSELDTDDVPASLLENYGVSPPDPAVPLSQLGILLGIEFPPGETAAELSIPILADGKQEPDEGVLLLLDGFGDPVVPVPMEMTGRIPATAP